MARSRPPARLVGVFTITHGFARLNSASQRRLRRGRDVGRRVAADGSGSLGKMTFALTLLCGKSFRLSVTMKSARPCSAHSRKGASPGSGSASIDPADLTCSASSRSRLTIVPMSAGRTRRRPSTALYSSTMSPLTSHTKLSFSIQSRISLALSFVGVTPALNPATPAATTDVSTTPLRRRFGGFGDNDQPRPGALFSHRLAPGCIAQTGH